MISSIFFAIGMFILALITLGTLSVVFWVLEPIVDIAIILIFIGIFIFSIFCLFVYPTRIYSKKKGFGILFIIYTLIQCINIPMMEFGINDNILGGIHVALFLLLVFGTLPFIIISLLLYYKGEEFIYAFCGITAIHVIPILGSAILVNEIKTLLGVI